MQPSFLLFFSIVDIQLIVDNVEIRVIQYIIAIIPK